MNLADECQHQELEDYNDHKIVLRRYCFR